MKDISSKELRLLKEKILNINPNFNVAIGISQSWNSEQAGKEVTKDLLKKLKNKKPQILLLFSTIHYADHGGFKKLLENIYTELPETLPLIGSSFAGFIVKEGVFTRGCCLMGIDYPNMDFAIGIGKNTKRAPKLAGKRCAQQIKDKLQNSEYSQKFSFFFPSATTVPTFPFLGTKRVFHTGNKQLNQLFTQAISKINELSQRILQKGIGMEDDVLEAFTSEIPDFQLIGGSSTDDNKLQRNFQFFNKNVYTNTVVALGIKTDIVPIINSTQGLQKISNPQHKITKTLGKNYILSKIDDKSAVKQYLHMAGMDKSGFDNKIQKRNLFLPLGFSDDDSLIPQRVLYIIGDSILSGHKFKNGNVDIYRSSGKSIEDSIKLNLKHINRATNKLMFIVSCSTRLEALGAHTYDIKKLIEETCGELPYLLVYACGETTYIPDKKAHCLYETFNTLALH